MLLVMLLMYTTAHHKIRQQCFEAFWYTHHLALIFFLGFYTHAVGCFVRDTADGFSPFAGELFWKHCIGYQAWRFTLWVGVLYFCERLYREVRAARETTITKVVMHPFGAMEIQFRKPSFKYKPGQWLFLNVPEVSRHQWHPFTITSCPSDAYISVHIRQVGDFTKALGEKLGAGPSAAKFADNLDSNGEYEIALQNGQRLPTLRIDGPYGAPAEDVSKYVYSFRNILTESRFLTMKLLFSLVLVLVSLLGHLSLSISGMFAKDPIHQRLLSALNSFGSARMSLHSSGSRTSFPTLSFNP